MPQLYDRIGIDYAAHRRADPRIAAAIAGALGRLTPIVNVGAGAGSYEPRDREVVAVEPSATMIAQRRAGTAAVVRASATRLPFRDGTFAAALAILTIHHWADRASGLRELARVARQRAIIVTHDPAATGFWLIDDYFPAIRAVDRVSMPDLDEFRALGGRVEVVPLPIPHDCTDGFLGAYWRRPEAYLNDAVRGAISAFARIADVAQGVGRLRADLASGAWERRYGHLRARASLDLGYRLVVVDLLDRS